MARTAQRIALCVADQLVIVLMGDALSENGKPIS